MRQAFAGLYSLGEDAIEEDFAAVKDVLLADGQGRYVLKPQREGGGYNYYGEKLAQKLRENVVLSEHDDKKVKLGGKLGEFILMERLFPPKQQAILLRAGKIEGSGETISELGCFGTVVASPEGQIVHNEYAGFLLRTKFSNVDEGGVASGFATLSSPYLC
jgi:glutathione synthase